MKALIFGVSGQDGYYLTKVCKENGIEPIGVSRSGPVSANIADLKSVEQLIKEHKPVYVFHLAANSTTQYEAIFENHETISTGTLNILHSVKKHSPKSKVFITGSGVQFQNKGQPISEIDPFEASSPYSVARIQSVYAARYYRSLGIKAYVGYLFHHESPLRKSKHVSQMIAQAVRRIHNGSQEKIELGDITAEKEWTFAGDVVDGIWLLLQQQNIFETVIGSGICYTIEDWLKECFGLISRNWKDHIQIRANYTSEYKRLISNPFLIKSLRWSPKVGLSELAKMMVVEKEPEC